MDEVRHYFVELPKMTRGEAELRDDIDRWAYFMRTAGKLDHVPLPLPLSEGAFARAFEVAEVAKMSEPEFEAYQGAAIKLRMELDKRRVAQEKGRAEGLALGIEKGRVEGMALGVDKGLRLAAARMLAAGMPVGQVAEVLGIGESGALAAAAAK